MARRRFRVDTIISILRRLQRGESCRSITQAGLAGRNKVYQIRKIAREKGWLKQVDVFPPEEEISKCLIIPTLNVPNQTSKVEPYRDEVEDWVQQGIRATVIHRTLKQRFPDFNGSYGSVLRFARKIKKANKEAFIPLKFEPGECAQVDFGSGPVLFNPLTGKRQKTYIFVMTLCFSRHMYVEIVWDQQVKTWLRCHRNAFKWFGGVVGKVILDNLKSAIAKASFYEPAVQKSYEEFARAYGFIISPCQPRKPRHKGRVEAGVKFGHFKNGKTRVGQTQSYAFNYRRQISDVHFFTGMLLPLRDFNDSIGEANRQLKKWVMEAGNRIHGTTKQMPLKMFAEMDKKALLPLPEEDLELSVWSQVKVHRDCHVTFEKAYYSAPFEYVGETLWLCAGEKLVGLYVEKNGLNEQVALHTLAGKPGDRRTNDAHLPPEKVAYIRKTPSWCKDEAKKVGPFCRKLVNDMLDRSVVDNIRAVQGILNLGEKYGNTRLESACRRSVFFDNKKYCSVKRILERGLDQVSLDDTPLCQDFDGRFSRDISQLLYPEKRAFVEIERSNL